MYPRTLRETKTCLASRWSIIRSSADSFFRHDRMASWVSPRADMSRSASASGDAPGLRSRPTILFLDRESSCRLSISCLRIRSLTISSTSRSSTFSRVPIWNVSLLTPASSFFVFAAIWAWTSGSGAKNSGYGISPLRASRTRSEKWIEPRASAFS